MRPVSETEWRMGPREMLDDEGTVWKGFLLMTDWMYAAEVSTRAWLSRHISQQFLTLKKSFKPLIFSPALDDLVPLKFLVSLVMWPKMMMDSYRVTDSSYVFVTFKGLCCHHSQIRLLHLKITFLRDCLEKLKLQSLSRNVYGVVHLSHL